MTMSVITGYMIDEQPGDGTRYTLSVVPTHGGGYLVAWYACSALFWADHHPRGDVLLKSCLRGQNAMMQAAIGPITKLLDRHIRGKVVPRQDRLIIGLVDGLTRFDLVVGYLDGWFGSGAGRPLLDDALRLGLVVVDGDRVQLTLSGRERAVLIGAASAPFAAGS